ncbi:5-formyltetrahydrofolate cyclo-ligase [Brachybacterium hainanense]|uniref:5-formyltetrahydrofolate cyclo-ligase n=1 Tax=Brachybacterium hainanense TaxID=1541174 RepID=A0ABV6RFU5_9MICO
MDASRVDLKAALRRRVRGARRRSGPPDPAEGGRILAHGRGLLALVRAAVAASGSPRVAAYRATPREADPLPLVRALLAEGAEVVMPVAGSAHPQELDWAAWDGAGEMVPSPAAGFGAEPPGPPLGPGALSSALFVLAPAVAVDEGGARIGHGAGYYDRALARAGREVLVVAVVHPQEVLPAGAVPVAPGDVPVHAVLTSHGLRLLRPHPLLGDMMAGGV